MPTSRKSEARGVRTLTEAKALSAIANPFCGRMIDVLKVDGPATAMPAAALIAGWLGSAVGVRETIAVMALIHVLGCAGFWWSPIRSRRDMPQPVDHPREHAYA